MVEHSTGWIAEVRKLNVVAQTRPDRLRKTWDEVLVNDRKKLDMDSADPQIRIVLNGEETFEISPTKGRGNQG